MKKYLLILFLIFSNISFGQSQYDMTINSEENYIKTRQRLDSVQVQFQLKFDTCVVRKMVISFKSWEKYRDYLMELKFPDCYSFGSSVVMCKYDYMSYLTNEYIKELMDFFQSDEGDVCNGVYLKKK